MRRRSRLRVLILRTKAQERAWQGLPHHKSVSEIAALSDFRSPIFGGYTPEGLRLELHFGSHQGPICLTHSHLDLVQRRGPGEIVWFPNRTDDIHEGSRDGACR